MNKIKKLSAFMLALTLCLSGCGSETAEDLPDELIEYDEESQAHTVAVLSSEDAINPELIRESFEDTLNEHYKDRITIKTEDTSGAEAILCIGEEALSSVASQGTATPIVFSEVMDPQAVLGSLYANPDEEITESNITGITSVPNIADQLSVILEITKTPEQIGIFYSPEDKIAELQNHKLEKYLDEAGISWKEYMLPSSDYRKLLKRARKKEKLPKAEKTIKRACKECSSLYLPSHGKLEEYYERIEQFALKKKVPTFGGDMEQAEYTLASLYVPESEIGLNLAKLVIDILDNGRDAGDTAIMSIADMDGYKIYDPILAIAYEMEFPKSFSPSGTPLP